MREEWAIAARAFDEEASAQGLVTAASPASDKLRLFRSLFKGREDVHAHGYRRKGGGIAYAPVCANEWVRGTCPKCQSVRAKCADCASRSFTPLGDRELINHFKGRDPSFKDVVGLYVLDSECNTSVLVADFDKAGWQESVSSYRDAAECLGIPVAVERSRSGNGGHAWIFFEEPIAASLARDLGSAIMSEGMARDESLSFSSYDRMFPAQSTIPSGGFGNLIALPFQGAAQRQGNSVFVDRSFKPYEDQWLFLSKVTKVSEEKARAVVERSVGGPLGGLTYGRQIARSRSEDESWKRPKSTPLAPEDFPPVVHIVKANMLYISNVGLSPAARNRLLRLAAFGNPEFYRAQAMHQSVFGKPRIVCLAEERSGYIALPRGAEKKLVELLKAAGASFSESDERFAGPGIRVSFNGDLRHGQAEAVERLLGFENGILSAPTGFGKTVIGAAVIARLKLPTLVIVPKTALLSQWKERLGDFLAIDEELPPPLTPTGRKSRRKRSLIGQIGGGKNDRSGIIDIATFQSLIEKEENGCAKARDFVKEYGLVIVDECHHGAAPQLECILKAVNARYVYGLSATPKRADGLEGITYLLCGPVRVEIDPKQQAFLQSYKRILRPRFTGIRLPDLEPGSSYSQVLEMLCVNDKRNALIIDDVRGAMAEGRTPLVVSKRKDHARLLHHGLISLGLNARLLVGEGTPKQRREAIEKVKTAAGEGSMVLVATESYLGEGFDMPQLDALFLTTPVSWGGSVTQQSGRLHREFVGKKDVVVFDYVDLSVPMLDRMYKKRLKTYGNLGYELSSSLADGEDSLGSACAFVCRDKWLSLFESDIRQAGKTILVRAPFTNAAAIKKFEPSLRDAKERGVEVRCELKKPVDRESADSRDLAAMSMLENARVSVVLSPEEPTRLAIIDHQLVWYGSLPLLAFPKIDDCSLRIRDAELAAELESALNPTQQGNEGSLGVEPQR
ncbi:DEAD/DEAH box helicase family protein [Adlercreutzia sp. R25]|uniref:TOTE conflict system archaeo-eukaryotic primase domain-containing protein n=1 Tax=Adlercreutzia shanghongiae TaxID=3111773 RepID=UPI002DBCF993|nr:DEAD/DEAH box helicase family protein [Adlercreutzia sp. R25]MEC4273426.1 DEAD/DEAH box helicase family protein [Adlercreutzia sp. R25]